MDRNNETIYFGHRFILPGEYESVLSAYKDSKVIYEDVQNITITNEKDFLMFDWDDVKSGKVGGEAYVNALNPNIQFASNVWCDEGNPAIKIYLVQTGNLKPDDKRRILYEYMCDIYSDPTWSVKDDVDSKWQDLFVLAANAAYIPECIWETETSVAALVSSYNESTEIYGWRILAEPLRK